VSVVGSETGMDARRVDADSSGAREGTARLSVRPLRTIPLRLSEECVSVARERRGQTSRLATVSALRSMKARRGST
jgi:hypothetical protein